MKKLTNLFMFFVAVLWLAGTVAVHAQTKVSQWGSTPRGSAWPILNTASTAAGNASMGADAAPSGWASIKGGFDTMTPTLSQALVITGTFEFVGGGGNSAYTWLRYAFFYQDPTTLSHKDSANAAWSGANCWGYEFCPRTGTGTLANGSGGSGTLWTVKNAGGWNSTYTNNGTFLSTVYNAPERAIASAGVYDWAISVQPLADGTNEIRYYFVKQHAAGKQADYWFGGVTIDPTPVTTKFNSIAFSVNNDVDKTCKQVNLANVTVKLGDPITVPDAPWQAYYINNWGQIGNRTGGWHVVPDPFGVVGNCGIAGNKVPTGNWATIRGGFDRPITATSTKALIVTGVIEFVGSGPVTWSGLRYGLFRHDSVGTVQYAATDTARWGSIKNSAFVWGKENYAYGYMFTPQSGTVYSGNIPGGTNASQGITKGGSWISTYGGAVGFGGLIQQAPARAVFDAGKYDFAFSVQPQADGSNEVRFYMIKQAAAGQQPTYWYGGVLNDPSGVTPTFNGICFGLDPNYSQTDSPISAMNLTDVKVDLGDPITVPDAPFQTYYLDQWALYGDPGTVSDWTYSKADLIGDATTSGTGTKLNWSALRGEFQNALTLKTDKALVVTGSIELVSGGFEALNSLRYGVFASTNAGAIKNNRWTGSEYNNSGYLFLPPSGQQVSTSAYWSGSKTQGTFGEIVNSYWAMSVGANDYGLGNILQSPMNAMGVAGTYKFALSIAPQPDGTTEIRNYLVDSLTNGKKYYWATKTIDNTNMLTGIKYNSVDFRTDGNATTTALMIHDVKIDLGSPITIPPDPNLTAINNNDNLPLEFSLSQNYPNPFNPTTTIKFALPKESNVRLVVYDLLGREVAELVNSQQKAGYHEVNFNASNLSSGVYFYSLKAGDFSSVKKLMLLK